MLTLDEAFVCLAPDRPVAVARIMITQPVRSHRHRFHEVSLVIGGRAVHVAAGLERPVGPGSVVWRRQGRCMAMTGVQALEKRNLYFSTGWLSADLWPEPIAARDGETRRDRDIAPIGALVSEPGPAAVAGIGRELDELEAELARDRPAQTLLRACVAKVLVHLARAAPAGTAAQEATRPELWSTLRHVEAVAAAGRRWTGELAARVGLAPDTLNRLVRAATGSSLTDLYQRMRIRQACRMLLDSRAVTVTEVAHRLGYADAAHFHRHFTKHMGCCPSELRRQAAGGTAGKAAH